MNGLNLSFKNINPISDELGITAGSGVSTGRSLTSTLRTPPSIYVPPPPPPFRRPLIPLGGTGSGVSSGAGLGTSGSDQNDALQVLNAANSRGKFETIASLVSQTLAGILPRSTQQVGGQTISNNSQGQVYTEAEVQAAFAEQQRQNELARRNGGDPNGGAGDVINQIVNFISTNPLAVGGFALAVYLLLKEPPVRRR